MKITGSEPFYPHEPRSDLTEWETGVPIRLHLAAMAMQGILAAGHIEGMGIPRADQVSEWALFQADDLLKAYNDSQPA